MSSFIGQTVVTGGSGTVNVPIPVGAVVGDLVVAFGVATGINSRFFTFGPGSWNDTWQDITTEGGGAVTQRFSVRKIFAGEADLVLTQSGATVTLGQVVLQVWRGAASLFGGPSGEYNSIDGSVIPGSEPSDSSPSLNADPTAIVGGNIAFSACVTFDPVDIASVDLEGFTNYALESNIRIDVRGFTQGEGGSTYPTPVYDFSAPSHFETFSFGFSGAPDPVSPSSSPSPSASPSASASASPSGEPCTPPEGSAISCVNARGRLFVTLANQDNSQIAYAWHEGSDRMPISSMTNWKRSLRPLTLQELNVAFETDNADGLNPLVVSVHRNLRNPYVRDARTAAGSSRIDSDTANFDSDNIGDMAAVFGQNIGGEGVHFLIGRIAALASPSASPSPSSSFSSSPSTTESASPSATGSASPSSSRSGSPSPSHSPSSSPSASPSRSRSSSLSSSGSASPSASPSSSQSASPSAS